MALVKATLKNDIKSILNELKDELNQKNAIEKFAEKLSTAIDAYIKSGDVKGTSVSGGAVTGKVT